ncbi:hypothetical protein A8L34_01590 [Bacillus sp. FJAT-27264]|uniref:DUF1801 domain-containing protein n=1 Tax=Paenibacillus sp. (strain DSM 101736 / FJAT-27264) TaxID=1850362 RepID=UPI000807A399|nr:DUF1801 domain-containing protein [Bacillus sp. FJAT-27264]OBZ18305.1 hypothetical protein A8L34_01590 [Bacillus sp. FJAT-27264]
MKYEASSPEDYIHQLPEERKQAIEALRKTVSDNLPEGFQETMAYDMIGYVVPHSIYPSGYHVKPEEPLPFISLASQKNFIAFYHMGIYTFPEVLAWFQKEYPKHVQTKLDMGKSCIRFKNPAVIPYNLLAELCRKITLADYLQRYEDGLRTLKKK